jgi:RNA polymerase-interacting CarD/CdnL/TRCF family regulator
MSRRFEEQRLSGMSWNDYVSSESQRLQDGVQGAADRAQHDRIVLEKVNADYQQAREWGDRIPQTDGMHSSMQLMNSQMNKVVTQNAEVIKALAKANMQQSQDAIDRSTEKQAHQNMLKDLGRAAVEVGVRERGELSRLRAK